MLDEELIFLVGCFTGWLLLGALALQFSANHFFEKQVSFKRAILTQLAMVWVLPIWTNAYFTKFADRFIEPNPEFNYLLLVFCLLPQCLVLMFSLKVRLFPAFVCLTLSLVPCYAAFRLAMPSDVLIAPAGGNITKANGAMLDAVEKLQEWSRTEDVIPIPVNREGEEIGGVPRSASGEGEIVVYFDGPSFLPPKPFLLVEGKLPEDPFKRKNPGTYSYAAGPIHGATAKFVLSSWGPDEVDQSEVVEALFLIECEGNIDRFRQNPETLKLMYSPTNGTVSPGELFRPGEGR